MEIVFSKELLEDEIPEIKRKFNWARRNMLESIQGTKEHQRWFDLMLHLGQQVIEMQEMVKSAPSEGIRMTKPAS